MSLRLQAARDAQAIVEDQAGFGWPIKLTDPTGFSKDIKGLSNDIALTIDPDTGMLVSGRDVTISVHTRTLRNAGFVGNPRGVSQGLPWVVEFEDTNGVTGRFKVVKTSPDRAFGLILMNLEVYR